jgi:uncharacterized membrane protein
MRLRKLRFEQLEGRTLLATFQGLGDIPGGAFGSRAVAVSADGSIVVGSGNQLVAPAPVVEAFRWTAEGGMQGLGDLPGGDFQSVAADVSADGSIIVGLGTRGFGGSRREAFLWTQAGGMQGLGDIPGGPSESVALAVSADGGIVLGYGDYNASGTQQAFRWTASGGMQGLGYLPGGFYSSAAGISADNWTIVGASRSVNGFEACLWTASGGIQGLGDLPGGGFFSAASDVSADGTIIVGSGNSGNYEAFRWTAADGMQGLGYLPGGSESHANAISADGSTIVGKGLTGTAYEAIVWTEADGMKSIRELLIESGIDMTGWTLLGANDVSADGRVVVGEGINPSGQSEAWRVVLDQIVALAWDENVPHAYWTMTDETGSVETFHGEGSTAAAIVDPGTRLEIRGRLEQMFSDAGIEHVSIVDGFVEGATNVYFANPLPGSNLLGHAFTGIDQFNSKHKGGVAIFITGDTELDAETVGHEVGHTFGLRHINPPSAIDPFNLELMDYDYNEIADYETFLNGVSEIREPPDDPLPGPGLSHNPVYHLKRYVDHVGHDQLASVGIIGGQWDLLPSQGGLSDLAQRTLGARIEFGESDIPLYDVHVFAGVSTRGDPVTELASFASLSLQDLEEVWWTLEKGTVLQLLAASSAGGDLDVILATGDPFDPSTRGAQAFPGNSAVSLQLVTNPTGGFTTLVAATLVGSSADYNANGIIDTADYVVWRKTLGATGLPAYSGADGDGDTTIDEGDYGVWVADYGEALLASGGSGDLRAGVNVNQTASEDAMSVSRQAKPDLLGWYEPRVERRQASQVSRMESQEPARWRDSALVALLMSRARDYPRQTECVDNDLLDHEQSEVCSDAIGDDVDAVFELTSFI